MVVNNIDFWECPVCLLQCHSCTFSVLSILQERGECLLKEIQAISVFGNIFIPELTKTQIFSALQFHKIITC